MRHGDTIIAIATPPGRGGIGVVRLSGPAALDIARSVFSPASGSDFDRPNRAVYGRVIDPASSESIDTAVATYFKAPHSYTGEDVVELSCHGSPVVLARVLQLGTGRGARVAEPGEFTLRALFNRRIDLAQAEAVRELINAQTVYQARVASKQIEGAVSNWITPVKQMLIDVVVQLESAIEFVEEDISTSASAALVLKLDAAAESLQRVVAGFSFGRLIKEGFNLAIAGRPNVGKSSVFNRLIGSERAIVTEIPGTTRDALYEETSIAGVPVRLVDTAGVRETSDIVEKIGISRTRQAIADADVVLLVIDRSEAMTAEDQSLVDAIPEARRILLLNKSDLPGVIEEPTEGMADDRVVAVSALTGSGFDDLTDVIFSVLTNGSGSADRDDIMITDARQQAALRSGLAQVNEAKELLAGGELEEVVILKLRAALGSLGEVTGETLTEDILSQIFSTFCIGK